MLLRKEVRELAGAKAFWLFLLVLGPLVGNAFITAVDLYAEASGIQGGPAALAQGLSPLDGVFVPALGAYDLAVTLLFPFVAIRVIAGERESGAWKLTAQLPYSTATMIGAKIGALLLGSVVAWIPGLIAVVLWRIYGGFVYGPELLNLLVGHLLRLMLSAGIAMAAAAILRGSASAAIATLAFTVGTWALDFIAAGRGGWLQKLARFTPAAALRTFEQGEFRVSTALVLTLSALAGLVVAGIFSAPGRTPLWRCRAIAGCALVFGALIFGAANLRGSIDLSENRRNSFSRPVEAGLRRFPPLRVTVNLAAEDPRRMDLERSILQRLERTLPSLTIQYGARSRSGLFEGAGDHYGEIWYELGDRRVMSRSTTENIVLGTLFQLARMPMPDDTGAPVPGHPLAVQPAGAGWIFYLIWPLVVASCWRVYSTS